MTRPWRWGCPECGEIEALGETVESIRRNGIVFDSRGTSRYQDDLGEIHSTVLGYHCYSCRKDFDKPRRYYGEMEIRWATERGHQACPVPGCTQTRAGGRLKLDGRLVATLCNGKSERLHPPTEMAWHEPQERTRVYMDWSEFMRDIRARGIDFTSLNQLEVNGKAFFSHENPASEVQIPQET